MTIVNPIPPVSDVSDWNISSTFGTDPNPYNQLAQILGPSKRVIFWVNNLFSENYVVVLLRVHTAANTKVESACRIWLRRQRYPIGISATGQQDVNTSFQLRVYRLHKNVDACSLDQVAPLVGTDPLGTFGFGNIEAGVVCDIYVSIHNPVGWAYNRVSAFVDEPWAPEGPNYKSDDPLNDIYISDKLKSNERKQDDAWHSQATFAKVQYHIGGSDRPDGSLDIEDA